MAYRAEVPQLQSVANMEESRRALFQTSPHAGRNPAADFLFIQRVEMQPRLPLLLVLRQQRKGHDGTDGKEINRLAARPRQSIPGVDGWRASAPAKIHP